MRTVGDRAVDHAERRAAAAGPERSIISDRAWLLAGVAVAAIGWGAQQFTPLLLLYQARLHLSSTTVQATFVPYVIGLVPGLLFGGPFSDRFGRRRAMTPTLIASAVGTVLLILGGSGIDWIFAGRLVSGMASGAGFSCGGAWIKELSTAGGVRGGKGAGGRGGNVGPRRLTVAMGVGFGLGPLVAGILAQWAPAPTVTAYLPQLVLAAVALGCVYRTPETVAPQRDTRFLERLKIHEVREPRFALVVAPLAPWVFAAVAIAVGYLPGLVQDKVAGHPIIFSAAVVVAAAAAGIFVQPFARRVDKPGTSRLLISSLALVVAGMLIAVAAAAAVQAWLVLLASVVLGAGYGSCQVYGLLEVQRLARPDHLAGLTAVYQALTYIGFMASYPLAAVGSVAPAWAVLTGVTVLAVATLGWTAFAASRIPDRRPDEEPGAAARPERPEPEQTSDGSRAATR
jgi:MFS family permease